jgi:hypothetical protein
MRSALGADLQVSLSCAGELDMADKLPAAIGETVAKASVALLVPYGGVLNIVYDAVRKRMQKTTDEILREVDPVYFAQRCAESQEFEAIVVNALDAAARSGYEAKRRLLGRVVVNAAFDDAKVDESALLVQALRELDATHIRALERIRLAQDDYDPPPDERANMAIQDQTQATERWRRLAEEAAINASTQEPAPVVAVLSRVGTVAPVSALFGVGISTGTITPFGRSLLDELRRATSAGDSSDV